MRILLVSTSDLGGGAEQVARNLCQQYRQLGHESCLAVGYKLTGFPEVLAIAQAATPAARLWRSFLERAFRSQPRIKNWAAAPQRAARSFLGVEDFGFPASHRLLQLPPWRADIVHCHNLHGGYFDLRALPALSRNLPVVFTLSDSWTMTGHCAQPIDCDRWLSGCGRCPALDLYPAVRRDATAFNWRRKRRIYRKCRLYVASPSEWLLERAKRSILFEASVESRIIPHGVDVSIFRPGDRGEARARLALPQNAKILLFAAIAVRDNPYKDYRTVRAAMERLSAMFTKEDRLLLVALGSDLPQEEAIGPVSIRFLPLERDRQRMANYYQAADIYIHAARAETWGLSVTESLACGTPVVATAVGGLPEQLKSLELPQFPGVRKPYPLREATGILVPPGDDERMASAIAPLLRADMELLPALGLNAAKDVRARFTLERQARAYLEWFAQIISYYDYIN